MFFRLGGSTIFHEKNSTKRLSLLDFNLEPLTDTLEALDLSDNGLTGLPMQFESRSFARLRDLDLSHNPIKGKVVVFWLNGNSASAQLMLCTIGVKVRNTKMDLNIYGNWCQVTFEKLMI